MRRSNGASEATGIIRAIYNGPVTVLLIITGSGRPEPSPRIPRCRHVRGSHTARWLEELEPIFHPLSPSGTALLWDRRELDHRMVDRPELFARIHNSHLLRLDGLEREE